MRMYEYNDVPITKYRFESIATHVSKLVAKGLIASPQRTYSRGSPYETQSSAVIINIPLASLIDPFIESRASLHDER